jgi:hypothetical protein
MITNAAQNTRPRNLSVQTRKTLLDMIMGIGRT